MLARVRQVLDPPVFENENKTRIASLLNVILLSIFVAALALTSLAGLIGAAATQNLINGAVSAMLTLAMWFIMRRGYVKLVSVLLSLMLLVNSTIAVYYTGTIRAPIATMYALGIVVAGLLVGNRAAVVTTVFSLLALLGLLQAERSGLLPSIQFSSVGITQWITYATTFGIMAVLLGLTTRSIDDALEQAHRGAHALTKANEGLQREVTERKRVEQLLQALNTAALAMERALTPQEIFTAVASEFKKLGFECMILPADEDRDRLFTRYLSFEVGLLKAAERLIGLDQETFSFPIEKVDKYRQVIWDRKTLFISDAEEVLQQVLPGFAQRLAGRLIRMLKVPKAIAAPLIVEEDVIGLFSVHSNDLVKDDIPIVTAFAHQIAAAWCRAQLFEQAQQEVTERKQAEEALYREKEFTDAALDSQMDTFFLFDPVSGKALRWNRAFRDISGYSDEEIASMPAPISYYSPEDLERVIPFVEQVMKEGSGTIELELICKDGKKVPTEYRVSAIYDKEERPKHLISIGRDITERKRAEEALRESEERFRNYFQLGLIGMAVASPEREWLEVNDHLCKILGYSRTELLGRTWDELTYPEDVAPNMALLDRVRSGEIDGFSMEKRFIRKNGEIIMANVSTRCLHRPDGSIDSFVTLIQDITERKRVEEALRRSEDKYRHLFELESDAIFLIENATGQILEVNSAATAMYGYSREELLHKKNTDLSAEPEETQQVTQETPVIVDQVVYIPLRFHRKKDGSVFPVEITGRFFSWGGRPVHIAAIRDITQRRQAEEALRREHALAQALEKATASLTATLDPDQVLDRILEQVGRVVPNDATNIMLVEEKRRVRIVRWRGYEQFDTEVFISTSVFDLDQVRTLRQMVDTGEPVIIPDTVSYPGWVSVPEQKWLRSYAGTPIYVRGEVVGFLNVDSATPGFFTQAHAETLRAFAGHAAAALENARLYEAEQQRSRELLEALERQRELDRLQSEFIQNVSHELRTPLALIRGYAAVLDSGELGELTEDQREPVAIIARRAQMLSNLVGDITSILKLETQKMTLVPVDLGEITEQVLDDFQSWATQKHIILRGELAADAPSVMGEIAQLRKVVDNLISNALKFTPEEGHVTLCLEYDAEGLTIRVTDTGIGIPPDKLDRIFERFYQVDGSASRRYGGTGLGLALVKEIVELHGGTVSVESRLGHGSVFTVWLPRAIAFD